MDLLILFLIVFPLTIPFLGLFFIPLIIPTGVSRVDNLAIQREQSKNRKYPGTIVSEDSNFHSFEELDKYL